jgi:hypothetical protein
MEDSGALIKSKSKVYGRRNEKQRRKNRREREKNERRNEREKITQRR